MKPEVTSTRQYAPPVLLRVENHKKPVLVKNNQTVSHSLYAIDFEPSLAERPEYGNEEWGGFECGDIVFASVIKKPTIVEAAKHKPVVRK